MSKKPNLSQILLLNLAMICIGTSGALGRSLTIAPGPAIWWRSLIGLGVILGWCYYKQLSFRIEGRKNQLAVLASGILMTAHWVTYFYALAWSNVAIAMISVFTYPAITTLLEPLLLKTRFQLIHLLLGALVLVGIYYMAPTLDIENNITAGIIMGVISATVYSFRNILMKTQVDNIQGSVLMSYQAVTAIILLIPVMLMTDSIPLAGDWPALLGLGILTTAIGHTLFLSSFQFFSVTTASLISSIQPVYGILFGVLLLGEIPSLSAIMGGGLILLSVVIEALRTRQASKG